MNKRIKELAEQAGIETGYNGYNAWYNENFAQLIIREHTKVLQQEWYRLNNLPPAPDESARDVGLRVGKKIQTVLLLEQLRQHFKANDE